MYILNTNLIAYTDGVTEAQNVDGELYGEERLLDVLVKHRGMHADAIHTAILDDVMDFVGDAPLADDITLMVLSRRAIS